MIWPKLLGPRTLFGAPVSREVQVRVDIGQSCFFVVEDVGDVRLAIELRQWAFKSIVKEQS